MTISIVVRMPNCSGAEAVDLDDPHHDKGVGDLLGEPDEDVRHEQVAQGGADVSQAREETGRGGLLLLSASSFIRSWTHSDAARRPARGPRRRRGARRSTLPKAPISTPPRIGPRAIGMRRTKEWTVTPMMRLSLGITLRHQAHDRRQRDRGPGDEEDASRRAPPTRSGRGSRGGSRTSRRAVKRISARL